MLTKSKPCTHTPFDVNSYKKKKNLQFYVFKHAYLLVCIFKPQKNKTVYFAKNMVSVIVKHLLYNTHLSGGIMFSPKVKCTDLNA
jgi:hypothetical protein